VAAGPDVVADVVGTGIAAGGPVALLALTVLLILRGQLVPRATLEDLRADRDARISELATERETWRAAYLEEVEARRLAQEQVDELLEFARTGDHLLRTVLPPVGEVTEDAGVATTQ
jgi:hypothetical protein